MNSFGRTLGAVAVAAGLFGYIYFVESKKDPAAPEALGPKSAREKVFNGFDKLKAKSLSLRRPDGELVHAEKSGEVWNLLSPFQATADAGEIGMILDALQSLETEEVVAEGAFDPAAYGLAEPTIWVSVTIEGAAAPFEFELGDNVPAASGLFARVPGRPRVFTVSSTLENTLVKTAFDLRDRTLVRFKKDDLLWFEVAERGKVAFRLDRAAVNDEWRISAPLPTRAARWTVDSFLGLIENLKMESIVAESATAKDLAQYGLGSVARKVIVGLGADKTAVVEVGKKTDENRYYAREASSTVVATINAALVDDLDKGLKNLRASRLLDVAAYEVSGLDVTSAGATKTFTKATTKSADGQDVVSWKADAPSKDAAPDQASDALFAIGGLDAAEFIDRPGAPLLYGLDAPALRVTLRFDGDKKEDWFEIGLKDDAAFARRRDDSAILKLDKAKTEALIKSFTALGS
jgi:hypothetical protein